MQKYISIFTSKKGKFVIPHIPFRNQIEMSMVMVSGLISADRNEFKLIPREEEGTEKIELIYNSEKNKIEIESTVNKYSLIYVLSELINRFYQKDTKNIRLTIWAKDGQVSVLNYDNIDLETICAITAGAIQKVADNCFAKLQTDEDAIVIDVTTNDKDEFFIATTEKQEFILSLLIEVLLNAVKLYN